MNKLYKCILNIILHFRSVQWSFAWFIQYILQLWIIWTVSIIFWTVHFSIHFESNSSQNRRVWKIRIKLTPFEFHERLLLEQITTDFVWFKLFTRCDNEKMRNKLKRSKGRFCSEGACKIFQFFKMSFMWTQNCSWTFNSCKWQ